MIIYAQANVIFLNSLYLTNPSTKSKMWYKVNF